MVYFISSSMNAWLYGLFDEQIANVLHLFALGNMAHITTEKLDRIIDTTFTTTFNTFSQPVSFSANYNKSNLGGNPSVK